ncbi:DUF4412 domain-containing protein [Robiginitalea aurantiaca]|uniref:DUF4412 domain-containing protein n=1 Tax=Robiginitalea aurantiaca TaxID=3056915 RepID=A0ABT7WAW0_9FLAO|nr:DUF4412 domain-containing protein [Robiginitalea aurantiaca]MDM9630042.1 DUF4412 domain-containing protein [Robiginitalea aurantiaca]
MKTTRKVGLLMALLFVGSSMQAQFLKKLKQKVENRVEQAVTEKIAAKAAGEADKLMDKAFDELLEGGVGESAGFPIGGDPVDPNDIADTYDFEWVYELTITTDKVEEPFPMEYLLKEGAPYWGMNIEQDETAILMVFDAEKMMTLMFMNNQEMQFMTASKIPAESLEGEEFSPQEGYEIKEIPGKTIMGYDCKGFEMEDAQYKTTVYTTFESEVGFGDMYKKNEHFPDSFDMEWIRDGNKSGMIMEMVIEDKTKNELDAKMVCTRLERAPRTISKADYQSLGGR